MFKDANFLDSINHVTLKFKDPDIEERYNSTRLKNLNWINSGKIMIAINTVISSAFFSYVIYMYDQAGNPEAARSSINAVIVILFSCIAEFLLHCFQFLHFLGGFPFIIMMSWVEIEVPSITLPSFAFTPGGVSFFLVMLFVGISYAKNWIMATIAQTIGYTLITAMAWVNFSPKMDRIRLITVELNLNIGLFVMSFIYYYFELQQRQTAYSNWRLEKVKIKINF